VNDTLIVVGNDKLGLRLAAQLHERGLRVMIDRSVDLRRVARLLLRGSLRVSWLVRMAWAEFMRPAAPVSPLPAITSNRALLDAVRSEGARHLVLFRAGLIVNRQVIDAVEVLNVHCARLPDYGGLGAIPKALHDRAYAQSATLHRVIETIDGGDVVATVPYELDPGLSYRDNEERAYRAGMSLILERFAQP
jgi:methionyl-tRNA formyltransferase